MAKKGRPKKGEEKSKEVGEDQAEISVGNNTEKAVREEIARGKKPIIATPIQSQVKAT